MTYAYIRVSTDKQHTENQISEIKRFCKANKLVVNGWVVEVISGTKSPNKRKLGKLMENVHEGDLIICTELSRLVSLAKEFYKKVQKNTIKLKKARKRNNIRRVNI